MTREEVEFVPSGLVTCFMNNMEVRILECRKKLRILVV